MHENERRIGLELEFAGLSEQRAAAVTAAATGGTAQEAGDDTWHCRTPHFGTCKIYLDSVLADPAKKLGGDPALEAMRHVVPVELVTEPFAVGYLPRFEKLCDALREAGALGSRDGVFFGFGLHLNVELRSREAGDIAKILLAYALLEDHLRHTHPIDLSRRALPFVDPYPDGLANGLARGLPHDVEGLVETYLLHAPSRNHGLDMLPILAELAPDIVQGVAPQLGDIKARPAFHFRLPDCRIDEADWSVAEAWGMWQSVEALAADEALLQKLSEKRLDWANTPRLTRAPWFRVVADQLDAAGGEVSA